MVVLEDILNDLGCEKPFDKNGKFTNEGVRTYKTLIDLLYDLKELTNKDDIASIIDELDKISNE